jgi:hypothetical protein
MIVGDWNDWSRVEKGLLGFGSRTNPCADVHVVVRLYHGLRMSTSFT